MQKSVLHKVLKSPKKNGNLKLVNKGNLNINPVLSFVRVVDFEFEREPSAGADREALHWSIGVT